jgi:hypothetical protein
MYEILIAKVHRVIELLVMLHFDMFTQWYAPLFICSKHDF